MITIVSGTNRKKANSYKIAVQYKEILKALGEEANILDLENLPPDFLTTAFYENTGKNERFQPMMKAMKDSDKFVFIVPEYNGSFPGILKLFLDALEFPSTLTHKKCAMVGLSSGVQGSALAMSHLTDIFNYLGMHVLAQKPKLMSIHERMENDEVTDELGVQLLKEQAEALIKF